MLKLANDMVDVTFDPSTYLTGSYVVNIFVVFFFLFYMFFIERNVTRNFFIGMTCIVVAVILYTRQRKQSAKDSNIDVYIDDIEKRTHGTVLNYDNIYQIHKAPDSLKFIKRSKEMKQLIYDLRHYMLYDEESFIKFVCLVEYFHKYHFLIVSNKYEYALYYPVMKDIRRNMINHLYSMYYNFPKYSTVTGIDDMDEYLYQKINYVQAYTFRYMRILNNKFAKTPFHVPPFSMDARQDYHYTIV